MPAIEPIDTTAEWDAIEAVRDTPRDLTEADWELLESLAAAGGPDGNGDLMRWGMPSTGRLLQLLEVPGPRLQNAINLLLLARRDDVIESLAQADYNGELLPVLTSRCAALHADRERRAGTSRPRQQEPAAAPPAPKGRPTGRRAAERWQQAQDDPAAALAGVAEVLAGDGTEQARMRRAATLLGIRYQGDGMPMMPNPEIRAEINRRLVQLGGEAFWPEPCADPAAEQWAACLANPVATIERVAELRCAEGTAKDRMRRVAMTLGIDTQQPAATLRAEITARLEQLEDAASGPVVVEPAPLPVVITAGPPAPGPQVVIEVPMSAEPEPAGPPPLTAEVLVAEAWAREPMRPTTAASLATWEALVERGESPDWRRHFGMLSDHWGPSAAAMISGVCSVPFAEVVAYGALVRERHQEDLMELRKAYGVAEGLLSDALLSKGWEMLSAGLQTRIEALWERCREITSDPRPSAA